MKIFMDINLGTNPNRQILKKYNLSSGVDGNYFITLGNSEGEYPSLQYWLSEVFYVSNLHGDKLMIDCIVSSVLRIWIDSYRDDVFFDLRLSGKDIKFFEKFSVILDVDYQNLMKPVLDAE